MEDKARPNLLLYLAVMAMLITLLLPQVWHRPVDRDEGFWLNSARLVGNGALPYRDFTLPHSPLLPYLYSLWCSSFGWELPSARLLSLLLAVLLLLLFESVARARHQHSAILALMLLGLSSQFLNWHIPFKIYAFYNLAVFAGWAAFDASRRLQSSYPMLACGVALGLAFAVRITALAFLILPLILIGQLKSRSSGNWKLRLGGVFFYLIGLLVGFMPALTIFALSWPLGYLQAWGMHEGILDEKTLLGRLYAPYELAIQTPDAAILIILAIIAFIVFWRRAGKTRIEMLSPAVFLLVGGIIAVAPGSATGQYFSTTIPFAAILVAPWLHERVEQAGGKRIKLIWQIGIALLMILGLFRFPLRVLNDYQHKPLTGTSSVAMTGRAIETLVPPGEAVLAFWPGYNALANRPCLAGTEMGKFTMRFAKKLPPEQWASCHLLPDAVWERMLSEGKIAAVVAGIDSPLDDSDKAALQADEGFEQRKKAFLELLQNNYREVLNAGEARIFMLKSKQTLESSAGWEP